MEHRSHKAQVPGSSPGGGTISERGERHAPEASAKQDADNQAVEEAKARVEADAKNRKTTEAQVEQFLTLAEKYDKVSFEAKHLIIAALVDRVEVNKNYEVKVFFKVSAEQFLGKVVRIA